MFKRSYLLASAFLALIALVAWWFVRQPNHPQPAADHAERIPQPTVTPMPSDPVASEVRRQTPGGPAEPTDPRWEERRLREKVEPGYEWKLPIQFYGRAVDEREVPVAGAKVWFQWSDLTPEGASEDETVSDAAGLFSLTGKQGNGLSIKITKPGYYTPDRGNRFRFENARFWDANYYEPNPENPVLFHLQTKGAAEPLIVAKARPSVMRDGTPVRLDLLTGGAVSASGQLEVAAWLPAENPYQRGEFNWRAKLSMPDGGLQEHHDEFPFIAPENGFASEVEFNMAAGAPDWKQVVAKSYYFRFGSPSRYGRMDVRINGASQVVNVDYWLNPSGSRNLENDPAKQITAK